MGLDFVRSQLQHALRGLSRHHKRSLERGQSPDRVQQRGPGPVRGQLQGGRRRHHEAPRRNVCLLHKILPTNKIDLLLIVELLHEV